MCDHDCEERDEGELYCCYCAYLNDGPPYTGPMPEEFCSKCLKRYNKVRSYPKLKPKSRYIDRFRRAFC